MDNQQYAAEDPASFFKAKAAAEYQHRELLSGRSRLESAINDIPAKEPSELEIIYNRLCEASDRANRAYSRLDAFLDRSLGPTPEAVAEAYPPASSPDSHLARIQNETDILLSRLQDINEKADRLSRIG